MTKQGNIVIIGGSAGSFQVVSNILQSMPKDFNLILLLALHRLKHIRCGFKEALSIKSTNPIIEPFDKEYIKKGNVYLAPANYHMFFEIGNYIALSTEEAVNHSRPSIDLSFFSAAEAYGKNLTGIVLSGANKDGALGLQKIKQLGGKTIIQDPEEAQIKTMPLEAKKVADIDYSYNTEQIIQFLLDINKEYENI